MNWCLRYWKLAALAWVCTACTQSLLAQEKWRTATVQGTLKARTELKNSKHLVIEILADGEESPRRYGVPYLPKEKGAIAEVHPAVLRANLGDRVRCDLVYGAYGYESGFTVVSFQVVKPAGSRGSVLTHYFPPPESMGGWRTLLPDSGIPDAEQKKKIREVAGVDWDKLAEAWEHNLTGESDSALLVIRRGYIVGEWYRGYDRKKTRGLYSSTKAYISTAFGLLLDDMEQGKLPDRNKLTLDTKVCNQEWLPQALPLSDPRKADITLRHLLFATSGIPPEGLKIPPTVPPDHDRLAMALGHVKESPWAKLTAEPGTKFNYSSPGVYHLILLFNNAAGMDLFPYVKKRVCDPIGMENVSWSTIGGLGRRYCTPGGFTCSAREHARFCYLAMHRGQWSGKQVVPAAYYDWAFQGTKANPAYGAQWWLAGRHPDVPKDFVQTLGNRHNSGYLVPSLDLVFVRIGDGPYPSSLKLEQELVKKVLAAVK